MLIVRLAASLEHLIAKVKISKKFVRTDKPRLTGWGFWGASVGSVGAAGATEVLFDFHLHAILCVAVRTWSGAERSMRLRFQSDAFLCDSVRRKRGVFLWPFQGGALPMSYPGMQFI
jgi:hypothetical protein